MNPNNVLVDREFNILAVIDRDSVTSVPDAALYRMPFLMGLACPVPGVVDDRPAVAARLRLGRRFASVVEDVSQNFGQDAKRPQFLFTRAGFFSRNATAFRSLTYVKMGQEEVNAAWVEGLRWLSEHTSTEATRFGLQDEDP